MLSFGFKGTVEQSETFLDALKLWSYHGNVGNARSLIVNSPKSTHSELTPEEQKLADIEPNLLRISFELEDADDLIADL
ncbi:PLP-dependent transferase, partial [Treponema endosymbiont of Eucomonympha sp.]|uniref:PLP-dependent transferase n=1 Tax=Treponema endosymbiont of Eucomonympha sp. TaxID=1580831 RepID=UPI0027D227FF